MKRLIVMRHAKSDWESGARSDHERPLNARGQRDAPRVARKLLELSWTPDIVISSDSTRTRETYALMRGAFRDEVEAQFLPQFYHAGIIALRAYTSRLSDDLATAMVLGHNPGWEEAVQWLTGIPVTMKTGAAALLVHEGESWSAALAEACSWRIELVIYPKEISDADL